MGVLAWGNAGLKQKSHGCLTLSPPPFYPRPPVSADQETPATPHLKNRSAA